LLSAVTVTEGALCIVGYRSGGTWWSCSDHVQVRLCGKPAFRWCHRTRSCS
jgi:hypothetical protein